MQPRRPLAARTIDAIVIVPGIMGSALRDAERGMIWGFQNPHTYLSLWGPGAGMTPLALTDRELDAISEGIYDPATARVQPAGLLRLPAFGPVLGGLEPYTRLVTALRKAAYDDAAVLEFAYDWRLPVRLNSELLARAMKAHLARWRAHDAHAEARRFHPEQRDAGIVIVAHSMGGLVARGLGDARIEGGLENVRQVITLGTPFYGSVKSTVMIERGEGVPVPLPRRRLRDVARTMPGLYDLLPRYRCLKTHRDGIDDVVSLSVNDVAAIGGNRDLAQAAADDFDAATSLVLPKHRPVIGIAQETWASLRINSGEVKPAAESYRLTTDGSLLRDDAGRPLTHVDRGDGTVWTYAARPQGFEEKTIPIVQHHGALTNSGEAIKSIVALVTDQGDLGLPLGDGQISLAVPDVVDTDTPFTVTVTGEADPASVECIVEDAETDELIRVPQLYSIGPDLLQETLSLSEPGLFRVGVKCGGTERVTQLVMVTPPER